MSRPSAFKTPEGEAAYLAAYDAAMKRWPVSYEEMEISSRFGATHVVVSGPKDAPPLVLLHGYMATLTMWAPNIVDFSRDYRVYAIDVMGQPSKSIPSEPIRNPQDYAVWLAATLDGLHLPYLSRGPVLRSMACPQLCHCHTRSRSEACAAVSGRRLHSDGQTVQPARDADGVLSDTPHGDLVHALAGNHKSSR